jgi:hypothetical protein
MQGVRKKTVPAFRNPSSYAIIVKSKQEIYMTASEFEHANKPGTEVRFNPFLVFVFFLTAPYLLFFLLLMLITGQFDVVLLAEAVWERDWDAYMKTWVIGTFVLSVLSALFVSGYRTERYLVQHFSHPSKPRVPNASNPSAARYVIEPDTDEDSEARYSGLGDAMERKEQ